jgi:uncharacterized protein (TIGR02147 family)
MKEQVAIQSLLHSQLLAIQSRNASFSLRSFAGKVGVHVGALSSIMSGKRKVSRDLAERITRSLLPDPQKRMEILDLFPERRKSVDRSGGEVVPPRYAELEAAQFKAIAEWEHYAVLSLMNCRDFEDSPDWIAGRLGITEFRASEVLRRLFTVGLIRWGEGHRLERTHQAVRTSDDMADLSLRKSHEVTLDLAKESLERDAIHERDFTYVTMAIDPRNIGVAKEMVRKFQDEIAEVLESGERTEVYRFATQLIPFTRLGK